MVIIFKYIIMMTLLFFYIYAYASHYTVLIMQVQEQLYVRIYILLIKNK